jgi:hypothetical protein
MDHFQEKQQLSPETHESEEVVLPTDFAAAVADMHKNQYHRPPPQGMPKETDERPACPASE